MTDPNRIDPRDWIVAHRLRKQREAERRTWQYRVSMTLHILLLLGCGAYLIWRAIP